MHYILTVLITAIVAGCGGDPTRSSDVAAVGASIRGEISGEGDTQTFALTVPVGTVVTITVDRLNDDMDSKVSLTDSDGEELASNDDGGASKNTRLTWVMGPQVKHLVVSAFRNNTRLYRLKLIGALSPGRHI
mgnify:CR=1 FL=1|jgi:hypothetical protein